MVPEAELNTNAKILVKFISQLNKSALCFMLGLKDYQMKDEGEEGERMLAEELHHHRRKPQAKGESRKHRDNQK